MLRAPGRPRLRVKFLGAVYSLLPLRQEKHLAMRSATGQGFILMYANQHRMLLQMRSSGLMVPVPPRLRTCV